jgi:hypothetical protein
MKVASFLFIYLYSFVLSIFLSPSHVISYFLLSHTYFFTYQLMSLFHCKTSLLLHLAMARIGKSWRLYCIWQTEHAGSRWEIFPRCWSFEKRKSNLIALTQPISQPIHPLTNPTPNLVRPTQPHPF